MLSLSSSIEIFRSILAGSAASLKYSSLLDIVPKLYRCFFFKRCNFFFNVAFIFLPNYNFFSNYWFCNFIILFSSNMFEECLPVSINLLASSFLYPLLINLVFYILKSSSKFYSYLAKRRKVLLYNYVLLKNVIFSMALRCSLSHFSQNKAFV